MFFFFHFLVNFRIYSVKTTCGQTTSQLDSYFQNPGWPEASQDRLICTLTVELQEDVAQIRLDFISFEVSKHRMTIAVWPAYFKSAMSF